MGVSSLIKAERKNIARRAHQAQLKYAQAKIRLKQTDKKNVRYALSYLRLTEKEKSY